MRSYHEIIKDEIIVCRFHVHEEAFRRKSFEGQNKLFGLIDAYDLYHDEYIGSMPLWWDESMLDWIMREGDAIRKVHRITVSTHNPMIHRWTYEDVIKGRCTIEDIENIECLPSGCPKVYNTISFLVREIVDNESNRWESRDWDIENTFNSVCRWCYEKIS
jgi:hypothetical protein